MPLEIPTRQEICLDYDLLTWQVSQRKRHYRIGDIGSIYLPNPKLTRLSCTPIYHLLFCLLTIIVQLCLYASLNWCVGNIHEITHAAIYILRGNLFARTPRMISCQWNLDTVPVLVGGMSITLMKIFDDWLLL